MQYLNEFHREQHKLSKQMEREHLEKRPMSPQVFIDQVNRLRNQSRDAKNKSARK